MKVTVVNGSEIIHIGVVDAIHIKTILIIMEDKEQNLQSEVWVRVGMSQIREEETGCELRGLVFFLDRSIQWEIVFIIKIALIFLSIFPITLKRCKNDIQSKPSFCLNVNFLAEINHQFMVY